MHAHTTNHRPVAATVPILFRLQDDPAIQLALAGELNWHDCRETEGAGRIAEWCTLAPGSWVAHIGDAAPVPAATVVEIEGADGSRHVGITDDLVWSALPADEGRVTRYRVMHADPNASPSGTTSGTPSGTSSGVRQLNSAPRGRRAPAGRVAAPRRTAVPMTACYCWSH